MRKIKIDYLLKIIIKCIKENLKVNSKKREPTKITWPNSIRGSMTLSLIRAMMKANYSIKKSLLSIRSYLYKWESFQTPKSYDIASFVAMIE